MRASTCVLRAYETHGYALVDARIARFLPCVRDAATRAGTTAPACDLFTALDTTSGELVHGGRQQLSMSSVADEPDFKELTRTLERGVACALGIDTALAQPVVLTTRGDAPAQAAHCDVDPTGAAAAADLTAAGLVLVAIGPEGRALCVWPGSHRDAYTAWPLGRHIVYTTRRQRAMRLVHVPPGWMLIAHPRLVHAGAAGVGKTRALEPARAGLHFYARNRDAAATLERGTYIIFTANAPLHATVKDCASDAFAERDAWALLAACAASGVASAALRSQEAAHALVRVAREIVGDDICMFSLAAGTFTAPVCGEGQLIAYDTAAQPPCACSLDAVFVVFHGDARKIAARVDARTTSVPWRGGGEVAVRSLPRVPEPVPELVARANPPPF